jgi:hypothetical protein
MTNLVDQSTHPAKSKISALRHRVVVFLNDADLAQLASLADGEPVSGILRRLLREHLQQRARYSLHEDRQQRSS